ncbi:unnamed protein product [Acanthoscelides obtectus]|uniref:Uncharacterized protein n=1 Tax=Acanthoscelides obtectus TaxID=200917 RepID=A0A9P0KAV3_ACAOB|nr:unnamed protein product [Acanthoscelides obtectus]CAK1629389.1 hypothetical protein AOBTE_LOCUS5715 [Acanthoscelides obtectus]
MMKMSWTYPEIDLGQEDCPDFMNDSEDDDEDDNNKSPEIDPGQEYCLDIITENGIEKVSLKQRLNEFQQYLKWI